MGNSADENPTGTPWSEDYLTQCQESRDRWKECAERQQRETEVWRKGMRKVQALVNLMADNSNSMDYVNGNADLARLLKEIVKAADAIRREGEGGGRDGNSI